MIKDQKGSEVEPFGQTKLLSFSNDSFEDVEEPFYMSVPNTKC